MDRTEPRLIAAAVCLSALAGFIDAIAYTSLGGFFASFMSGNSTRLGVGLGGGDTLSTLTAGSLVLSFVSGVILSSVLIRARPGAHMPAVMGLVTLLIAAAAALAMVSPGAFVLLLLAAAMGAENGLFHRDGEVSFGLTYMTGSLVRMGQRLAGALMGDRDRWGWLPFLALWLGFVAGVVLGVRAFGLMGWYALWFATAAAAVLTLLIWRIAPAARGRARG